MEITMKEILLKPQEPYFSHLDVDVLDFPNGTSAEPRKRMTVTIEYSEFDVNQIRRDGRDLDGVMEYYNDWLYDLIRARLLDDWTAVSGLEETMSIVRDHISGMFEA
jgi:hypothetical protein